MQPLFLHIIYFWGCCCPFHQKMAPKPSITTLICGCILKLHSSSSPVPPSPPFFSSRSVLLRYTTLRAEFCSTEVWSWPGKNTFALVCAKVLAKKSVWFYFYAVMYEKCKELGFMFGQLRENRSVNETCNVLEYYAEALSIWCILIKQLYLKLAQNSKNLSKTQYMARE